jgi:hypothetical protein
MAKRLSRIVIALAAVYLAQQVWFWPSKPIKRIVVYRGPAAYSGTTSHEFRLERFTDQLTVRVGNDAGQPVDVEFVQASGKPLCRMRFGPGKVARYSFSVGRGFEAGSYTVRVVERELVGRYAIDLYPGGSPAARRRLLLVGVGFLAAGGWYAYVSGRRARYPERVVRGARGVALCFGLAAALLVLYPLLHEGGHAIALAAFHRLDLSDTDFIGLGGEPHAGITPGPRLPAMQQWIVSLAGPALPTVVGYVLFLPWLSGRGRSLRNARPALDFFWSVLIAGFLFAWIGYLAPMTGLAGDSDYSGFVQGVGLSRWQANGILLVVMAANAAAIVAVVRHLLSLRRLSSEKPAI